MKRLCWTIMWRAYTFFLPAVCLFFVVASVLVTWLTWKAWWLIALAPGLAGLWCILGIIPVLRALPFLFQKWDSKDDTELEFPEAWMPGLFQLVRDVAARNQLPLPDVIRLSPFSVAYVYEDDKRQKILVLGGVGLALFPVPSLSGIVAHELGHFAAGDTAASRNSLTARRVMAIVDACFEAAPIFLYNPVAWAIRGYHIAFQLLDASYSRDNEYAADQRTVEHVGAEVGARSLLLLHVIEQLPWARLVDLAESLLKLGIPSQAIFSKQVERARASTADDWQRACRKAFDEPSDLFDSHPRLLDRLNAIGVAKNQAMSLITSWQSQGAPASQLLGNWPLVEKLLSAKVTEIVAEGVQAQREIGQILSRT